MEYSEETDYLCIDAFIKGVVEARSLATAIEAGLIDHLLDERTEHNGGNRKALCHGRARRITAARPAPVEQCHRGTGGQDHAHRPPSSKALRYRDLLETKLEFAHLLLADFTELFTDLVAGPGRFSAAHAPSTCSRTAGPSEYSPENYALTKRWVAITTSLTRYEAASCVGRYAFGLHRRMLDIGGNSGEFVLQICRKYSGIRASVLDLPLVCEIGREHLAHEPEAERISFIKGNVFTDPLPETFDIISFKSMLHDWPEKDALLLIEKAALALAPGGVLLIFERGRYRRRTGPTPPYSAIPILLFFRYFRDPAFYERHLSDLGLHDVRVTEIMLDAPFYLITARKRET